MIPALAVEGLKKTYATGVEALGGIDLRVEEGDFYALLGPNGAGKSTAIGIIASLVTKSAGRVAVFGHDLDDDWRAARSTIGIVPQEFNFNVFEPVEEILINQAGYYGIARERACQQAEKYLRELELWDKRRTQARDLSGGMKRRLMIARALVHEPRLLILDEPTAGVDLEIRHAMWEFLQRRNREGTTIILTTHYLEEAESLCRRIAVIHQGRIVEQGGMRELLARTHGEHLVLSLTGTLEVAPVLKGFRCELVDPVTLEVQLPTGMGINALFAALSAVGIEVLSMRNKHNRLEQAFLQLLRENSVDEHE